jgi:hypothetical protein
MDCKKQVVLFTVLITLEHVSRQVPRRTSIGIPREILEKVNENFERKISNIPRNIARIYVRYYQDWSNLLPFLR